MAVFARDGFSGKLSLIQLLQDGVDGVDGLRRAAAFVLSPDGKIGYVFGGNGALPNVIVFSRNPKTGRLHFMEALQYAAGKSDLRTLP